MKAFKYLTFVIVFGFCSQATAQTVQPNSTQSRSQRDVVESAAKITKMAYVTSKSHTKVEYVKGAVYKDGGYDLTYQFFYRDSDNDPQTYTLRFEYNASGKITEVKTVQHSSFWEPFNAIKIAGAVAEGIANEMNKR
jgi:hypothetical protein